MEENKLGTQIEALIFASDRPLSLAEIKSLLLQVEHEEVSEAAIAGYITSIGRKYDEDQFPFELLESGGGYQFLTKKKYHPLVLQLNGDKYTKKLSTAALETLSIIAYKQPVTKADIELIRGVSADYSIQKLLEKELISIAGRKEDAIGKPLLYATTRQLMDYLGINSPAQLPELKEIMAVEIVRPSMAEDARPQQVNIPSDENATGRNN
jgi:segregation and condensation protein B